MSRIYVSLSPEIRTIFSRTQNPIPDKDIEIDEVYRIVSQFNESRPADEYVEISALLDGCEIVRREPQHQTANLSALSEMELMRLKADERRYQKSIANVATALHGTGGGKSEIKSASESLAFASHFILAFGSAFLLGYYLGEYVFGFEKAEFKYIVGGACSFATLILESVLFIIRDQKQTQERQKPVVMMSASKSVSVMTTVDNDESSNVNVRHRKG